MFDQMRLLSDAKLCSWAKRTRRNFGRFNNESRQQLAHAIRQLWAVRILRVFENGLRSARSQLLARSNNRKPISNRLRPRLGAACGQAKELKPRYRFCRQLSLCY